MQRALAVLMMLAVGLAGCSDGGGKDPAPDPTDELGLEATDTTGVIRGVVVDERIVPIAGATIKLLADGQVVQTTANGAFGFDGLDPGTYFVEASKAGFSPVQQGIEVVAGESEPPVARFLLAADSSFVAPYFEGFVLEGFIQCGTTTSVIAAAVCSIPNGCNPGVLGICATNETYTEDNFNQFIELSGVPMFIQHEVVWEATQATGNQLNLAMRTATADEYGQGGYGADIGGDIIGVSPLVGVIDQAMIEENGIGKNGTGLAPAVFTGGTAGTEACVPGGGCTFATGATVNQKFSLYTHVFYGYMPPEGWRFSESSTVPAPPS